jgi:lipoate-protein ligase A
MPMQWRWREDTTPGDPWTNMVTDQALFDAVRGGAALLPTVRIYRWDRRSVSVGRLQNWTSVERAFPGVPAVRRPTGGRAVIHGQDLTVSVVMRSEWLPETGGILSSYRQIARGLMDAFSAVGVTACLGSPARLGNQHDIIDCFAVSAGCDLVEEGTGRKLVGSAQRREGGALLQQMSIPALVLPDERVFITHLKSGLGRSLGVSEWLSVDFTPPV